MDELLNQSLSRSTAGHYGAGQKNIFAWRLDDVLESAGRDDEADTGPVHQYLKGLSAEQHRQLDGLIDETAQGYDERLAECFVDFSSELFRDLLHPLASGVRQLGDLPLLPPSSDSGIDVQEFDGEGGGSSPKD